MVYVMTSTKRVKPQTLQRITFPLKKKINYLNYKMLVELRFVLGAFTFRIGAKECLISKQKKHSKAMQSLLDAAIISVFCLITMRFVTINN